MKSIYIFLFIPFILFACGINKKRTITLEFHSTKTYDNRNYSGVRFAGVIFDSMKNELVYFVNTESGKNISIYRYNGEPYSNISLKNITKSHERIESIKIITLDSILVITKYTNKVYLLNRKGKIIINNNIINRTPTGKEFETESSITNGDFACGECLFLMCSVKFPHDTNLSIDQAFKIHTENRNSENLFVKISNYLDSSYIIQFGVPNFYNRIVMKNYMNIEPAMYSCLPNGGVILYSMYSDSLFLINKKLELYKSVNVKSQYTDIGSKAVTVGSGKGDSLNLLAQTSGIILNVLYDSYRNYYAVSIRHSVSFNSERKEKSEFSPWSIILLDENFDFIEEIPIKSKKYAPGELLIVKEGYLLYRNDGDLAENVKFDLYEVHKN